MRQLLRPSSSRHAYCWHRFPPTLRRAARKQLDPARFAAAQQLVLKIVLDGAFAKIMNGLSNRWAAWSSHSWIRCRSARSPRLWASVRQMRPSSRQGEDLEITAIVDPYYKERAERTMKAMFASMGGVCGQIGTHDA